MSDIGNFFTGFAQSFAQGIERKKQREQDEQEKKARVKLFEIQLEKEQEALKQKIGQREAMEQLQGLSTTQVRGPESPNQMGPPQVSNAPRSLLDMLADPQTAMLMQRAGLVETKDILGAQESQRNRSMIEGLARGGTTGGPSGLELSGIKLDTAGKPMLDFARREIWKEVPSQDGMTMIQLDRQGRQIGSRPVSPGEKPQPTDEDKRVREMQNAYSLYGQARKALDEALEGTMTGPLIGKAPAITSSQQEATGAIAAMAPILKQMFRAAGEGVFTDRDQALLLEMIPTRETLPEAREAILRNMDAIVRAKLGIGNAAPSVIDFNDLPD